MKLRASEYISKAEGLKSSELTVRQKLEGIKSQRLSVQSRIDTLSYRLDSLYARMEALESSDSDDEDGSDNSAAIAAIMDEIVETRNEISENQEEDAELRSQEMDASAELRQIEIEEQQTLSEIQDSAARENQNIALISAFGGDYSNVSSQAAGSFQQKLAQFSQAAQILGGTVAMGSGGSGGNAAGRLARGNLGEANGSGRNFYEAANNQRKAGSNTGAMGAKGSGSSGGMRKAPNLYAGAAPTDEPPTKKTGGMGRKPSAFDNLAAYMYAHNYGKEDYDTYSRDPEWQKLHKAAFPDYYKQQEAKAVVNINQMGELSDRATCTALDKAFTVNITSSQNDTDTQRFFNAIGWSSKKPMIVDEETFNKLRDSLVGPTLYHTDMPFGEVTDAAEYAKQFMATSLSGNEQYFSGGIHGDGTYFSTNSEGAWAYGRGKPLSTQYKAILNQNARIIDEYDLDLMVEDFKYRKPNAYEKLLQCSQGYGSGRTDGMKSIIAAMNGYNIIRSEGNFVQDNEMYYTILDRSAVTVCSTIRHYGELVGNPENW